MDRLIRASEKAGKVLAIFQQNRYGPAFQQLRKVIASGVLGPDPSPHAIELRLKATARDLGPPGYDTRYGAGLVDAARATARP